LAYQESQGKNKTQKGHFICLNTPGCFLSEYQNFTHKQSEIPWFFTSKNLIFPLNLDLFFEN